MSESLQIILAEEDEAVREFLQLCLMLSGHTITLVTNGIALVNACRNSIPDLVVSDVDMRELDGIGAALEIRQFSLVPVILLSGRWDHTRLMRAESAGVKQCLSKPVLPKDLESAIKRCFL